MNAFSSFHQHPYYIVTPPFRRSSAGVRCLHLLCHSLNRAGHMAYVLQDPDLRDPESMITGTDLVTPILTPEIARDHARRGQKPIVVYPETVPGNPFNAQVVVRYLLNFPGLLGGDTSCSADEIRFAYSDVLGQASNCSENILFIPPIDTSLFKPPPAGTVRAGSCFYADKFRKVHGGRLSAITSDSVEILRGSDRDQSGPEIAALLKRSKVFYTYENTALAIEAVLCGCPAVFIPNPHLTSIIASTELGPEGYAWGTAAAAIEQAAATVVQGRQNYLDRVRAFDGQFEAFVAKTQAYAAANKEAVRSLDLGRDLHIITVSETGRLGAEIAILMARMLPAWLEKEMAKFSSTFGMEKIGARLWRSAQNRYATRLVVRHAPHSARSSEPALVAMQPAAASDPAEGSGLYDSRLGHPQVAQLG